MNMKHLLNLLLVIISVSVASIADASDSLVDSVRKVFASYASTIKYDMISVAAFGSNAYKQGAKKTPLMNYFIKDGNKELSISGMRVIGKNLPAYSCDLHTDGFSYRFSIDKPVSDAEQWANLVGNAFKVPDEENMAAFGRDSMYKAMLLNFKYHFLPLLPDENKILLNEGEVMQNVCTEYSASGSQAIEGKNLQFIEYKTPAAYPIDMTTRYYFDNGRIVKCVSITKQGEVEVSPEVQAAYGGTLETRVGGYTIINIHEFTTDVDATFLTLPKGIKIVKNPFKQ